MSEEKALIRLPFNGKYPITFKFGEAPDWYVKVFHTPHNGVDFGCPIGTPILAAADGWISYADSVPDADGEGINIAHPFGYTQYWHLSRLSAIPGQVVKAGDLIGLSGNTGFATGPHLHFGLKSVDNVNPLNTKWLDPILYIGEPAVTLPEVKPVLKYYTIQRGDNLWKIAIKYYKDGYQWRKIWTANQAIIADPALIYAGTKILIP